jgi:hypothetical protein
MQSYIRLYSIQLGAGGIGMRSRIFGMLVLASGLSFGIAGVAYAAPTTSVPKPPIKAAPELDPGALSSGLTLLGGGLLMLTERRRGHREAGLTPAA